jgi:hypothetical protein
MNTISKNIIGIIEDNKLKHQKASMTNKIIGSISNNVLKEF